MQLWSYDEETDEVHPGENVKIKVSGVDEEVLVHVQSSLIVTSLIICFVKCNIRGFLRHIYNAGTYHNCMMVLSTIKKAFNLTGCFSSYIQGVSGKFPHFI